MVRAAFMTLSLLLFATRSALPAWYIESVDAPHTFSSITSLRLDPAGNLALAYGVDNL